jgi:hypothetical protein
MQDLRFTRRRLKRPQIKTPCVADRHHGPGERIAEVTFPDGRGCLISTAYDRGVARVDVYRADPGVVINRPTRPGEELAAGVLFNCCESLRAPNWSTFASFYVAPVRDMAPERGHEPTECEQCEPHEAEFWSVYARSPEGMSECLTDCHGPTMEADARAIMAAFEVIHRATKPPRERLTGDSAALARVAIPEDIDA